ncbi:MAG: YkgJ family cysteine cluster protein [Desulfobacterales bacterium]
MRLNEVKPNDIFKCMQCGDCCKGYGGTFISEGEIEKIAAYIHTDPNAFVDSYCEISGGKMILAQAENMYCIFWDGLCTIHPVKPRMCKTWPFIESVIFDFNNWHIMASLCPGIRTNLPERIIKEYVAQKVLKRL